jgi:hypothetical protein
LNCSFTLQEVYLSRIAGGAVELAGSPGAAGVSFAWGQAFLNLIKFPSHLLAHCENQLPKINRHSCVVQIFDYLPDVVGCVKQEDRGLDAIDYILREEALQTCMQKRQQAR